MADHGVNPFIAMPVDKDVQNTLQSLSVRVSQLGAQIESLLGNFETRIHHLSARLLSVEKRQVQSSSKFQSPDAKRIKVDGFRIPISEQEIGLMHSQLTGPVKDAIHELGRVSLSDSDIALTFLRIGSDKSVAITTLHSKEFQATRDSINWSFLPVDVVELLEQRFVKTIAKKVEHTKRKIRRNSPEDLIMSSKYGKTEKPFVDLLLDRVLKRREIGKFDSACSSLSTNLSPNTAASTSDVIFEAKAIFVRSPQRKRPLDQPAEFIALSNNHNNIHEIR